MIKLKKLLTVEKKTRNKLQTQKIVIKLKNYLRWKSEIINKLQTPKNNKNWITIQENHTKEKIVRTNAINAGIKKFDFHVHLLQNFWKQ